MSPTNFVQRIPKCVQISEAHIYFKFPKQRIAVPSSVMEKPTKQNYSNSSKGTEYLYALLIARYLRLAQGMRGKGC